MFGPLTRRAIKLTKNSWVSFSTGGFFYWCSVWRIPESARCILPEAMVAGAVIFWQSDFGFRTLKMTALAVAFVGVNLIVLVCRVQKKREGRSGECNTACLLFCYRHQFQTIKQSAPHQSNQCHTKEIDTTVQEIDAKLMT